jgi:hypothetical protein
LVKRNGIEGQFKGSVALRIKEGLPFAKFTPIDLHLLPRVISDRTVKTIGKAGKVSNEEFQKQISRTNLLRVFVG